jgi:ATP citrate (pro-S)-lyase
MQIREEASLFAVAQSGRRVLQAVADALNYLTAVKAGMIFAEGVPEQHAISIRELAQSRDVVLFGPSSVGIVVPGIVKLGAIGGVTPVAIQEAGITQKGTIAVVSSSGGMVNELINMVARNGGRVSFAAAIGGERYPATAPLDVIRAAIQDPDTKAVLYFGELGGSDEHDIAKYLRKEPSTKPIIAYIAGIIAEYFEAPPQFGHAKALAAGSLEKTSQKKRALAASGVLVANSFLDLEEHLRHVITDPITETHTHDGTIQKDRKKALFVNRVSQDKGDSVKILGDNLVDAVSQKSFAEIALSMLLGKRPTSQRFTQFFDECLKLLIDHGPQVSGAVTSMITARAGKDIGASVSAGILTIGPRFGGAINDSARLWFEAVARNEVPYEFVERLAKSGTYIAGIGHKKYRLDNPDPRVARLVSMFCGEPGRHMVFAREVERITTAKKSQLILNVDGAIAAICLDILENEEGYTKEGVQELIDIEFFNALFILARSFGFAAHALEQRRLGEGLFRLPDNDISSL